MVLEKTTSKKRKFINDLKIAGENYILNTIKPALENAISYNLNDFKLELDDVNAEVLNFTYPTINSAYNNYIKHFVKIEFGTRAQHSPTENKMITSLMADALGDKIIGLKDEIMVKTLDPKRTFWEKATYLHSLNNGGPKKMRHGLSRHLYDIYQLWNRDYGNDIDLLIQVTEHKKRFFYCKWANYDEILNGKISLKISSEIKDSFRKDYSDMAEMFWGDFPDFDEIISLLENADKKINLELENYNSSRKYKSF